MGGDGGDGAGSGWFGRRISGGAKEGSVSWCIQVDKLVWDGV